MLKEKLMEDLKQAMKDKNVVRKNVVQMVRAAILQFEKDNGIEVEDNKILDIIAKEVKKRKDSLADFEKAKREDLINQAKEEIFTKTTYKRRINRKSKRNNRKNRSHNNERYGKSYEGV